MTTYGTIPSPPPASLNPEYVSNAKEQVWSGLGTRRPWKEMFQGNAINLPTSFNESVERIKANAVFFRINYAFITLFILVLRLLWNPFSLIVFTVVAVAWLFLYFLRKDPLVVSGRLIEDRVVMMGLLLATIASIFFTNVSEDINAALFLGVVVVSVHGALRKTRDEGLGG